MKPRKGLTMHAESTYFIDGTIFRDEVRSCLTVEHSSLRNLGSKYRLHFVLAGSRDGCLLA